MVDALVGETVSKFVTNLKSADASNGTFKVIFTSGALDRHGETVNPDGWDFTNYYKNPVVLYGHNYSSLPVGVVDKIYREDGNWIAEGRFAPEDANPMAGHVRRLYEGKFLKTVSVGFIPTEMDANFNSLKQELLEISFVPVPANPEALSLMKSAGLDVEHLVSKGMVVPSDDSSTDGSENGSAPAEPVNPQPPVDEEKAALSEKVKTLEDELATVKAGRTLSEATRGMLRECADGMRTAMRSMEKSISALEDLLSANEPSSGSGDDSSKPDEGKDEQKGVNVIHIQRLLRVADKSVEDVLRSLKRR